MKNNELKFLANLAKQTLMNKDYSAETKTKRNTVSSYYIQNARALKRLKAETNYVKILSANKVMCLIYSEVK